MTPVPLPPSARRIVIAGGPAVGKSMLAKRLSEETGFKVRGTDELQTLGWSEASAKAAGWLREPGPWILEGVAMARALRKWVAAGHQGKPCDLVIMLAAPRVERSVGQIAMAKGVMTVWREVVPTLIGRDVRILYGR